MRKPKPAIPTASPIVWIFGGFGALMLLGALLAVGVTVRSRAMTVQTTGSVVDSVPCADYRCVRIAFQTADGRTIEFQSTVSTSWDRYAPEDKVRVRYNPAASSTARLDDFMEDWFVAAVLGGLGLCFVLVAALARRL
jgi:hypothetical protein